MEYRPLQKPFRQALAIFCLYLLNIFAFECILPIYAGGGWYLDWALNYDIALVFSKGLHFQSLILPRTPLYNLTQGFFLPFSNYSFWEFQLINVLLSSVFLLSVYLLAEKLFDARVGLTAMCVVFLNPWCMHSSWFTWPKMLAVYFTTISVYFYIRYFQKNERLYINMSALFAGLGYLTHPLALFYITGMLFDLLFLKRRLISLQKRLECGFRFFLIMLIVTAPWFIYTILTTGLKKLILASPVFEYPEQNQILISAVITRLHSATFSMLPFHILIIPLHKLLIGIVKLDENCLRAIAELYFNPLMGCLTLTGTFASLSVFIGYLAYAKTRNSRPPKNGIMLWRLFVFPTLAFTFLLTYVALAFFTDKIYFRGLFAFYEERFLPSLLTAAAALAATGFIISHVAYKKKGC